MLVCGDLLGLAYVKRICFVCFIADLAPYFTNSGNTATASDSEPVGTAIFRLFVTDDDPYDVAGLTVYMITASAFFDLNSDCKSSLLTHLSLASHKWDVAKKRRPR